MDSPLPTIVEVVRFRLQSGVSDDAFLAASDALQRDLAGFPGYRSRRLLRTNVGQWLDLVEWETLDAALQAAAALGTRPNGQDFITMLEAGSIEMLHLTPVRVYQGASVAGGGA